MNDVTQKKKSISQKGRRNKGRDGRYRLRLLLEARDWKITTTIEGASGEDLLATDPDGVLWAVEVKDVKLIDPRHRAQAMRQARKRNVRWLLANHIFGTSSWLIQGQNREPVIWRERDSSDV